MIRSISGGSAADGYVVLGPLQGERMRWINLSYADSGAAGAVGLVEVFGANAFPKSLAESLQGESLSSGSFPVPPVIGSTDSTYFIECSIHNRGYRYLVLVVTTFGSTMLSGFASIDED